jgi:hypothetical protein
MSMLVELTILAEEKYCNEIVMFMAVYPVLGTLWPVCDCKLIRCVDLHTFSRPMFG